MVSLSVVVIIDYYLTPALTAIHVQFHLTVKMKIAPMVTKMTGAAIATPKAPSFVIFGICPCKDNCQRSFVFIYK